MIYFRSMRYNPLSFVICTNIFFVATSSDDFDITLMICLLRSLSFVQPPTSGWDKLPPVGENSLGANLARIKFYRNTLCHTSKNKINDKTFKRIWSCLTHVSFNIFYCMVLITKIFNTTLHSFNRWIMVVRMFRKHNLLFLIQLTIKSHLNSSKRNFKMIIKEYVLSFRREFFKFLFLIITKRQFYLFLFIMHVYRLSWILKCLFSICKFLYSPFRR